MRWQECEIFGHQCECVEIVHDDRSLATFVLTDHVVDNRDRSPFSFVALQP